VVARSVVPDAGFECCDVMNGAELFIMDRALSRSLTSGFALATRTIPLGEYWMTGGAGLPVQSADGLEEALRRITAEEHPLLDGPGGVALPIVRACLEVGAADHVAYEGAPKRLRHGPRWLGAAGGTEAPGAPLNGMAGNLRPRFSRFPNGNEPGDSWRAPLLSCASTADIWLEDQRVTSWA
jgi:hypothetical protein